ncbi:MAG: hypothetical protein ACRDP8_05855 [Actinopolymorphaceae bacterium]
MTTIRLRAESGDRRTAVADPTENPMTREHPVDSLERTIPGYAATDLPRSTSVHLLQEELARAQIHERVRQSSKTRQATLLVRARRLSRKSREAALRARLTRARFG